VTPVLLALIAAAQSIVATVAMAYVRIRTHVAGTVPVENPHNDNAPG
jgi:hypothetical protein